MLVVASVALVWGTGQGADRGGFTAAGMDGVYAFVAGLGAGPDDAAPASAVWLVARYNGDGTASILTVGSNEPAEPGPDGAIAREASVVRPDPPPTVTYEMSPDGTFVVVGSSGDPLWDGLVLRSEAIDGVLVATEYVLFHRQPDAGTGGLNVGRGVRQAAR
ncbi:MAG TPA: hypothetical protein VFF08_01110 [Trueperaceae bacterium]|nr:hypothetical protein [Trueperaceae bacterium]